MRPLLALLLLPAFSPAQSPAPARLTDIDAALQQFVDAGELSGAVAVVGRADGTKHTSVVGRASLEAGTPMAADTPFRIASMTKPVTAVAVMTLVEAGRLSVDDPVEKHLPEFKGQMLISQRGEDTLTLTKPARPVTVKDLLTHTGGLAGNYGPGLADAYTARKYTLKETTLVVAQKPLEFAPGTKWSYCNPGIDTLGRLAEVLSGTGYEDYCRRTIFDPLGMTATTFHPTAETLARTAVTYGRDKAGKLTPALIIEHQPGAIHPIPAGGLVSTGADYARFLRMVLNKGELDGRRVLKPETATEMTRNHTGDLKAGFTDGMGFGYGFAVVNRPTGVTATLSPGSFGHGGAFGTQAWADPANDRFVVLLVQRTGLPNADASPYRRAVQELAARAIK